MNRRVVVTGAAGMTSLGNELGQVLQALKNQQCGIERRQEWEEFEGLRTLLAGPVGAFTAPPEFFNRKNTRSMGRVSLMSALTAYQALKETGLLNHPALTDGSTGVSFGSSSGSPDAIRSYVQALETKKIFGIPSTAYIKMMSHTTAANLAILFQAKGRVIPTSSACTSGSQGIGYAYEAIKWGKQTVMIAGGAEELCLSMAVVFDIMFATSTRNNDPQTASRPFDQSRDGLVIGEGAATLILEEYEHARQRGANILGEIIGFGSNSDGQHVTNPSSEGMAGAMRLALEDAGLPPQEIGYICAHGTATSVGDIAESKAVASVFGSQTPLSSLKGNFGHTLGACGAIESWLTLGMMQQNSFAPTLNLTTPDPQCAELDYIMGSFRPLECEIAMNNNFAFGGINTSLIFKKFN